MYTTAVATTYIYITPFNTNHFNIYDGIHTPYEGIVGGGGSSFQGAMVSI